MKNKILAHFQANYLVKVGHPCNDGVPSTNMKYFVVESKDGKISRSGDDDKFVKAVLKEMGVEYKTELFMLVLQTSNTFVESMCGKLGIHM